MAILYCPQRIFQQRDRRSTNPHFFSAVKSTRTGMLILLTPTLVKQL